MSNSRFKCAQCKQYGEVDSVFRSAGLARLCSTECYSQYLDEARAKRKRNNERAEKAEKPAKPARKRSTGPKIPGEVRHAVRERDQFCRWCGGKGTQVHHVVYRSQGGPDKESNLLLLCNACHERAHSSKEAYQHVLLEYLERVGWGEQSLTIPTIALQMHMEGRLGDVGARYFNLAS